MDSSCWVNSGLKYAVVITWLTANSCLMWYTYNQYKYSPEFFYLHEILGAGLCWSRGTAAVINLNLGVLLVPMCRAILGAIRGPGCMIPMRTIRILIDHCKGFHVFCAYIVVVASVVHFFGHCFNAMNYSEHYNHVLPDINAASKPKENPILIVIKSVPGVTGLLLLIILGMMVSSAMYAIRSTSYDVFWFVHRLFIIFYALVLIHGMRGILMRQRNVSRHTPGCLYVNSTDPWPEHEPVPELSRDQWICLEHPVFSAVGCSSWLWMLFPLTVYIADVIFRIITRQRNSAIITSVTMLQGQILELQVKKDNFRCRPGQYVMIQCPDISSFEWHPYTVTKIPVAKRNKDFTIHIQVIGDWSEKLKSHLVVDIGMITDSDLLLGNICSRRILVDGPFGSPMEDVLRYRVCLCIAGGIGITPYIALLNYIRSVTQEKLHRFYLIWVSRDVDTFLAFADLLWSIYSEFWESSKPELFSIKLFITSTDAKVNNIEDHILLRRRLFFGRPDWDSVFCNVASTFPGIPVGVFCCGSKSLSTEVGCYCNKCHHNNTKFHFYHESF